MLKKRGNYQRWRDLYENKQESYYRKKTRLDYTDLYINTKVYSRLSDGAADLVMADTPKFMSKNNTDKAVEFIDLLVENTNFEANGKTMVREQSWRGCVGLKGRLIDKDGKLQPVIETFDPATLHPIMHPDDNSKMIKAEIRWELVDENDKKYLRVERHEPQRILQQLFEVTDKGERGRQLDIVEFYMNNYGLEIEPEVATGTNSLLIVYVPNYKTATTDFEGLSDYEGLENIVFAIENLLSEANITVNGNLRPKWIAPMQFGKPDGNGGMYLPKADVYFSSPMQQTASGLLVPSQLSVSVDTNMITVNHDILQQALLTASELSPASFGYLKDGTNVDSGKALKFRFYNPLQNAARKRSNLDNGFKQLAKTLMEVAKYWGGYWNGLEPEEPLIEWSDGLGLWEDTVDNVMQLFGNGMGVISVKEALRQLYPTWSEEKIDAVIMEKRQEAETTSSLDGTAFANILGDSSTAEVEEEEQEQVI